MVEQAGRSETGIEPSPGKDKERTDSVNQHGQPVPSVCIQENVSVAGDDGSTSNQNSHSCSVISIQPICSYEVRGLVQEIRHEEADN